MGWFLFIYFFFRLPQIYEEFYHTINNADHEKDLKWWSNNHGVNMAMNWPQFEVIYRFYVYKRDTNACKFLLVIGNLPLENA